jgi:nucleoside-diphosphate kinase
MSEYTLALLKPDAWRRGLIGSIIQQIETSNSLMSIKLIRSLTMTRTEAEAFYREHRGMSYYEPLINHIISGPCVAIILEGPGVGQWWRNVMGPADPAKRQWWSLRERNRRMGDELYANLVHGSDSRDAFIYETTVLRLHPGLWQ